VTPLASGATAVAGFFFPRFLSGNLTKTGATFPLLERSSYFKTVSPVTHRPPGGAPLSDSSNKARNPRAGAQFPVISMLESTQCTQS